MSYLPGIPHLPSSALKCPSQGTRPSPPPHVVAQRVPEYVVAQRAPGCNRSSRGRAVLEGHRAFGFLGEAASMSVEAPSLGQPADSNKCSQELQNVPATAAAQPQNLVENLNSEEPSSPTPSIPAPIAGSVPRSKWGLHGSSTAVSPHTPTGDSHKNTAAQAP